MFLRWLIVFVALSGPAWAERSTTREAFERLDEVLEMRREDGIFRLDRVSPMILVSAQARYVESKDWHGVRALSTLARAFGAESVRVCEACMRPRTSMKDGQMELVTGPASLDEIRRFDDRYRGDAARARTAVWLDETASGVAFRIVDLSSGQLIFAQNVDPELIEYRGSKRHLKLAQELERRTRGDTITHAIFDMALYPGQHISIEWSDQWGETNANLSGVVLSFFDPVLGIGAGYHRALEWYNILVGGQLILSLPTVLVQAQTDSDTELLDPAITAAAMLRVPFGRSNYAGLLSVSTNGNIGIGISLLNTSFIPVLP